MSGGMTTANTSLLRRAEVWSSEIKEILRDELMAMQYVRWLTEFPDGDTFKIPSIGQAVVRDYEENQPVVYDPMDIGQFTFQITDYIQTGNYITKKAEQDGFYMEELVSRFVPEQERALMVRLETDILGLQSGQTSANSNVINGASHRIAGGNSGKMELADFAYARYALKKANVPDTNLVAIVDPSVEYYINTISTLISVSDNPKWEGIISDGIASGMRFVKNIYGFDVYTSNYLADISSETLNEADGTTSTAVADGKANLFFSAASGVQPFIGAWRQTPEVEAEWKKDLQRTEFITTARYGLKLYRPENLFVVVADPNV